MNVNRMFLYYGNIINQKLFYYVMVYIEDERSDLKQNNDCVLNSICEVNGFEICITY